MAFPQTWYTKNVIPLTDPTYPSLRVTDTKIMPGDDVNLGAGLFDHPVATFLTEIAIFFAGLWVYTTFTPAASKAGINANPNLLTILSAFMVVQQAHFCFGAYVPRILPQRGHLLVRMDS